MDDHRGLAEQLLPRTAEDLGDLVESLEQPLAGVAGRRARLVDDLLALADDEEVGEGSADVDADPKAHAPVLSIVRSVRVSPSSTVQFPVSMATPYSERAAAGEMRPSRTSARTSSAGRSRGSP